MYKFRLHLREEDDRRCILTGIEKAKQASGIDIGWHCLTRNASSLKSSIVYRIWTTPNSLLNAPSFVWVVPPNTIRIPVAGHGERGQGIWSAVGVPCKKELTLESDSLILWKLSLNHRDLRIISFVEVVQSDPEGDGWKNFNKRRLLCVHQWSNKFHPSFFFLND